MPARRRAHSRALPPLDVLALWQIKRVGNPTLSPDGRVACASVTLFSMDTNESKTELWLFPTGMSDDGAAGKSTGRPLRITAGDMNIEHPCSPNGKQMA